MTKDYKVKITKGEDTKSFNKTFDPKAGVISESGKVLSERGHKIVFKYRFSGNSRKNEH